MKLLINKDYNYSLFHFNNKLYLTVICGSVALYEVTIELNKEEKENYLKKEETYIDKLALEIQSNSKRFAGRFIENFQR
ncbi:MAG: hypothetical protein J0L69_12860 [Bacteroidetes bacterium]|nr:hypothetical protein [Bacteroidota bacterium]